MLQIVLPISFGKRLHIARASIKQSILKKKKMSFANVFIHSARSRKDFKLIFPLDFAIDRNVVLQQFFSGCTHTLKLFYGLVNFFRHLSIIRAYTRYNKKQNKNNQVVQKKGEKEFCCTCKHCCANHHV